MLVRTKSCGSEPGNKNMKDKSHKPNSGGKRSKNYYKEDDRCDTQKLSYNQKLLFLKKRADKWNKK